MDIISPYPAEPYPIPSGYSSGGRLERVLRAGKFAITAELNPPDSADAREVYERAHPRAAEDRN